MNTNLIKTSLLISVVSATLIGCKQNEEKQMPTKTETTNVLLQEWQGDFGGVPAFDKMNLKDLKPALLQAMETNSKEIEAIANNKEAPTFENTIVALEKSGQDLDRVFKYYGIWSANMSSKEFRGISKEMAPVISDHRSKTVQNQKLFSRIKSVYEN